MPPAVKTPAIGTVYGTLLNHRAALAALGSAVHSAPYQAPPRAPVLYIKPRNTFNEPGRAVPVPAGVAALRVGATLGLVVGRNACRVAEAAALDVVAGCVAVAEFCVPHESFYRPSVRFNAIDGSCVIGAPVPLPPAWAALEWRVFVDGVCEQRSRGADLVRPAARLLADVTDFMTLVPGDVLLLGVAHGAPLARAGQRTAIEIEGVGRIENTLVAEDR